MCDSHCCDTSFGQGYPELRPLLVLATQTIFFSSAYSRLSFISAQRRTDRGLHRELARSLRKERQFHTGGNKYVLIQRRFPPEQSSHLMVCLCAFPGWRRGATRPNLTVLQLFPGAGACVFWVQQLGWRDQTFWVSPASKKCSNWHILRHTEY